MDQFFLFFCRHFATPFYHNYICYSAYQRLIVTAPFYRVQGPPSWNHLPLLKEGLNLFSRNYTILTGTEQRYGKVAIPKYYFKRSIQNLYIVLFRIFIQIYHTIPSFAIKFMQYGSFIATLSDRRLPSSAVFRPVFSHIVPSQFLNPKIVNSLYINYDKFQIPFRMAPWIFWNLLYFFSRQIGRFCRVLKNCSKIFLYLVKISNIDKRKML